jgi:hypothetical protein
MVRKHKTYLILGGAGLIGRTFAYNASKRASRIVIVDLPEKISKSSLPKNAESLGGDIFKAGFLENLFIAYQPDVVLNTINVATIFSGNRGDGYHELIGFYARLYEALSLITKPLHYIQVGTTGSGGLGFNIPFTHGEGLEQKPIIHKAAFSGITSQLLVMLSRSFPSGKISVSEIKPGLAIFDSKIQISKLAGASCVTLDGGESGHYTYNEVALLMRLMGFTTADLVVEKIMAIIDGEQRKGKVSSNDITAAMNASILTEGKADGAQRKKILKQMRDAGGEHNIIATGNLGPRSVTAQLLQSYMRLKGVTMLDPDASVRATLAYLSQKDLALAEYVENFCQQVPPLEKTQQKKEPWELVEM